jgi:hypothetical protein
MPAVSVPRRISRTGLSLIVSEFTNTIASTTKNAEVNTTARIEDPQDSGELTSARLLVNCRALSVSSAASRCCSVSCFSLSISTCAWARIC